MKEALTKINMLSPCLQCIRKHPQLLSQAVEDSLILLWWQELPLNLGQRWARFWLWKDVEKWSSFCRRLWVSIADVWLLAVLPSSHLLLLFCMVDSPLVLGHSIGEKRKRRPEVSKLVAGILCKNIWRRKCGSKCCGKKGKGELKTKSVIHKSPSKTLSKVLKLFYNYFLVTTLQYIKK